jgi:hypothetical protein
VCGGRWYAYDGAIGRIGSTLQTPHQERYIANSLYAGRMEQSDRLCAWSRLLDIYIFHPVNPEAKSGGHRSLKGNEKLDPSGLCPGPAGGADVCEIKRHQEKVLSSLVPKCKHYI